MFIGFSKKEIQQVIKKDFPELRARIKSDVTEAITKFDAKTFDELGPELRGQLADELEQCANLMQSELIRLASHVRHG